MYKHFSDSLYKKKINQIRFLGTHFLTIGIVLCKNKLYCNKKKVLVLVVLLLIKTRFCWQINLLQLEAYFICEYFCNIAKM